MTYDSGNMFSKIMASMAIITMRYTPGFIRTQERNDLGSLLHAWLDESAPFEKEALYDMLTNAQRQIQRIKLDIRGSID